MIHVEHREMYRPNGLIDDFVVYSSPSGYIALASRIRSAIETGRPEVVRTSSEICIEIQVEPELVELRTSLQNQANLYATKDAWAQRDILRLSGGEKVLGALSAFLVGLSARGEGYSYISEYSKEFAYAANSPQWSCMCKLGSIIYYNGAVLELPARAPNKSFKPTPLRGAA